MYYWAHVIYCIVLWLNINPFLLVKVWDTIYTHVIMICFFIINNNNMNNINMCRSLLWTTIMVHDIVLAYIISASRLVSITCIKFKAKPTNNTDYSYYRVKCCTNCLTNNIIFIIRSNHAHHSTRSPGSRVTQHAYQYCG